MTNERRSNESFYSIYLTATGMVAAIALENLVSNTDAISDAGFFIGLPLAAGLQALIIFAIVLSWWIGYASLLSRVRWALNGFDLVSPLVLGAGVLVLVSTLSPAPTGEFYVVLCLSLFGGAVTTYLLVTNAIRNDPDAEARRDLARYPLFLYCVILCGAGALPVSAVMFDLAPGIEIAVLCVTTVMAFSTIVLQTLWWVRINRGEAAV